MTPEFNGAVMKLLCGIDPLSSSNVDLYLFSLLCSQVAEEDQIWGRSILGFIIGQFEELRARDDGDHHD